jgi:hypothetical protein
MRHWRAATIGSAALGAVLSYAPLAASQGSLSSVGHTPLEQRVALAIGPDRTSLWTQLRVDVPSGELAIVAPAKEGASLDIASAAWFEALELATAPRILPPPGAQVGCPGESPVADPVLVEGQLFHEATLAPVEVLVLEDATDVAAWAAGRGLEVSPALAAGLAALEPTRFVALRFSAPHGVGLTPALRITGPDRAPVLPLMLTEAGDQPLLVSTWTLAEGSARPSGPAAALVDAQLVYDAATASSNYGALRSAALAVAGSGSALLEASGRDLLLGGAVVGRAPTGHVIPELVRGYFDRAAIYHGVDGAACASAAAAALASAQAIGHSCARAALGFVGAGGCSESSAGGEVDPAALRCGVADDLAVALSGQVAAAAWVTRHSLQIPAGGAGALRDVASASEPARSPAHSAGAIEQVGCGDGGGGGDGGAGSGAGHQRVIVPVPVYADPGCGSSNVGEPVDYESVEVADEGDAPDAYYYQDEGCSGQPGESTGAYDEYETTAPDSGDDCGGDTSDSYDDGDDSDDWDSDDEDTYDSDDWDSDEDSDDTSSGDDCGGDTSDSYDDSDDSDDGDSDDWDSDDGDSDSSGSESGGDSGCSVRPPRRPRLSLLTWLLALVLFPLRRSARRRAH